MDQHQRKPLVARAMAQWRTGYAAELSCTNLTLSLERTFSLLQIRWLQWSRETELVFTHYAQCVSSGGQESPQNAKRGQLVPPESARQAGEAES